MGGKFWIWVKIVAISVGMLLAARFLLDGAWGGTTDGAPVDHGAPRVVVVHDGPDPARIRQLEEENARLQTCAQPGFKPGWLGCNPFGQ